jgi:hypothetical protein
MLEVFFRVRRARSRERGAMKTINNKKNLLCVHFNLRYVYNFVLIYVRPIAHTQSQRASTYEEKYCSYHRKKNVFSTIV